MRFVFNVLAMIVATYLIVFWMGLETGTRQTCGPYPENNTLH